MQRPNPSKNSRSFLQKFQGKKNAISRQGLLHLLEAKRPSVDNDAPRDKQKAILLREPRLDPLAPTKQPREMRAKSNGKDAVGGQAQALFLANDLQQRYARMREQLRQPKSVELVNGSKVRLPAINKANNQSHSTQLHKKNTETAPAEHSSEEIVTQRMKSMPRKAEGSNTDSLVLNNLGKKIELDKYALRHLQFLDKFEKQLLKNDPVAKKTSRSEYH